MGIENLSLVFRWARLSTVVPAVSLAVLAGCSGSAGVDSRISKNINQAPTAVVTPIGIKPTASGSANGIAMVVRSGSAVILSGKDSNGNGIALAGFQWTQTGGPALPKPPDVGAMLYDTSNTVSFTAPQVAIDTALTFQLTVTNALGASSSATATVTVTAANDPSEFLVPNVVNLLAPPRRIVVAVAPSHTLTDLSVSDVACVSIARQLSYISRDGTQHDGVHSPMLSLPQLSSLQANVSWSQGAGATGTGPATATNASAAINAALQVSNNPRAVFDVPAFNDLELAALFNQPTFNSSGVAQGIDPTLVNQQLVASDIDTAQLYLSITAVPGSCDGKQSAPDLSGVPLAVGVYPPGTSGSNASPALTNAGTGYGALDTDSSGNPLTADALVLAANTPSPAPPVETLASAKAYYNSVDPPWAGAPKTDLNTWLDANCFDHTQSDYGTGAAGANGAHAQYTNNFDLGFGRDMYFIKCTADHKDASGNTTAHSGDMAAVVLNYASLEALALKQQPILAVAMEYQGAGHTAGNCTSTPNSCIVKFYAFAPDDRTGLYQRVASANFDRRGEKFIPGACLSCHGGAVTDASFASADVKATFMPWDVGSLLFSDTDPSFKGNLVNGAAYTQAVQLPNLENLNALAWQTWQSPEIDAQGNNRYQAPMDLLSKWYGFCATSADPRNCKTVHAFSDSAEPASGDWPIALLAGSGTTASGDPNDLYHGVYAHHCRACHTQNDRVSLQFNSFAAFKTAIPGAPTPQGLSNGVAQLVFDYARMPLARLTADRFWVDFGGGTSAAQMLSEYINGNTATVLATKASADAAGNTVASPGAPVPVAKVYDDIDTTGPLYVSASASNAYTLVRFGGARLDLSSSLFTVRYASAFTQTMPVSPPYLAGADTGVPSFDTYAAGTYQLQVGMTSATGIAGNASYTFAVAAKPPVISASCPTTENGAGGMLIDVPLTNCVTQGDEPARPPYNVLQIESLPGAGSCKNSDGAWGTSAADPAGTWQATVSAQDTYGVAFTFSNTATVNEAVTICYRLTDIDGKDPIGTIQFKLADTLTANSSSFQFNPPAVTPTAGIGSYPPILASGPGAFTLSYIVAPADPAATLVLTSGTTADSGSISPLTGIATTTSITQSGSFSYTPPIAIFLTCDVNGQSISSYGANCTPDTFAYHLLSGGATVTSNTAVVSVNVKAQATFNRSVSAGIYVQLVNNCAGCHGSTTSSASNFWVLTLPTAGESAPNACAPGTGCNATYASITGNTTRDWTQYNATLGYNIGTGTGATFVGHFGANPTPGVLPTYATTSTGNLGPALFDNPCNPTSSHYKNQYPGTTAYPGTTPFCTAMQQWLLEGGPND